MTPKEADRAAALGVPVILAEPGKEPREYERITQVGYNYHQGGWRTCFVQLLDKCGNSVVNANPAHCQPKEVAEA